MEIVKIIRRNENYLEFYGVKARAYVPRFPEFFLPTSPAWVVRYTKDINGDIYKFYGELNAYRDNDCFPVCFLPDGRWRREIVALLD